MTRVDMTQDASQSMTHTGADEVADALRALEHERCRAISELDLATLQHLLDDALTHTHVNGMTQDRRAYLAALSERPRRTHAGPISVRRYGDVAILAGMLTNTFVAADGSSNSGELHALRVWHRHDGEWRLVAFAASGAGSGPRGASR